MSIPYGANPYNAPVTGGYGPTYKVKFDWISEAWTIFSREAGIWIGSLILYTIIISAVTLAVDAVFGGALLTSSSQRSGSATSAFGSNDPPLLETIIIMFVSWIFHAFAAVSLFGVAVKQLRGERVTFGDAFGGLPALGNALVVTFLGTLLYVAGFVGLCIGAFVAIAFMMPLYALTADGESVLSAFGRSFDGMKRDWITATGFVFVWFLIYIVSAIPCYLGLLATIPMTVILGAIAYRDMVGMPGALPPNAMGYFPGVPSYGQPQAGQWPPPPTQAPFGQASGPYGQQSPYGTPQGTPPPYGQPGQVSQPGWQQPQQSPQPGWQQPVQPPIPPQPPQSPWQPPQQGPGQPPDAGNNS